MNGGETIEPKRRRRLSEVVLRHPTCLWPEDPLRMGTPPLARSGRAHHVAVAYPVGKKTRAEPTSKRGPHHGCDADAPTHEGPGAWARTAVGRLHGRLVSHAQQDAPAARRSGAGTRCAWTPRSGCRREMRMTMGQTTPRTDDHAPHGRGHGPYCGRCLWDRPALHDGPARARVTTDDPCPSCGTLLRPSPRTNRRGVARIRALTGVDGDGSAVAQTHADQLPGRCGWPPAHAGLRAPRRDRAA